MIGVYDKRAYKLFLITKLFMIAIVASVITIASFAGNNEEEYIEVDNVVTISNEIQ